MIGLLLTLNVLGSLVVAFVGLTFGFIPGAVAFLLLVGALIYLQERWIG